MGVLAREERRDAATARSAAGSEILSPRLHSKIHPDYHRQGHTGLQEQLRIMERRPESHPTTARRGVAREEGAIRL